MIGLPRFFRPVLLLTLLTLLGSQIAPTAGLALRPTAVQAAPATIAGPPAVAASATNPVPALRPSGTPPSSFTPAPLRAAPRAQLHTRLLSSPPIDQPTLISRGKKATASFVACPQPICSAARANDGDITTRWTSDYEAYPQWWQVDLGRVYTLTQVLTYWWGDEGGTPGWQYEIRVSEDDPSFADPQQYAVVASLRTLDDIESNDTFTARGRYVRIHIADVDP